MDASDLTWLAQKAQAHSRIVEIGSWLGRSTLALADHTAGKVWAVDTWRATGELEVLQKDHPGDWIYEGFLKNLQGRNNVVPVRMTSLEASRALSGLKYDMIFIDGSHDYASVKEDIEAWRPLLQSGGLLCGHDFDWLDVKKAVYECLPQIARAKALGPAELKVDAIWYTILFEQ